jgi:hypothetical protein
MATLTKEQATARELRLAWHVLRDANHKARAARHAFEKALALHLTTVARSQERALRNRNRRQLRREAEARG